MAASDLPCRRADEAADVGGGSPKDPKLFIISGPSGVGKSTVVRQVLSHLAGKLDVWLSVSVTTRPPRAGEADGREYRFLDQAAFDRLRAGGGLIEHAQVHGHWYGTPAAPVREALAAGRHVLLEIDVQGGIQAAARFPKAMGIFIEPPSRDVLRRRIVGRATEDPAAIRRRLEAAEAEWKTARECGAYAQFIVNDDLAECVLRVASVLLKEARS
jgi:guanylate kinase